MLQSLWIMRHGLAVDEFESDFSRALSENGKMQAASVAQQMLACEKQLPIEMLVSPFVRTQETAQIVHTKLNLNFAFKTEKLLTHFSDYQLLGEFLLEQQAHHLMIVSHMPIVAKLCQYFLPDCNIYGFQTAQIVKLQFSKAKKTVIEKTYLAEVLN